MDIHRNLGYWGLRDFNVERIRSYLTGTTYLEGDKKRKQSSVAPPPDDRNYLPLPSSSPSEETEHPILKKPRRNEPQGSSDAFESLRVLAAVSTTYYVPLVVSYDASSVDNWSIIN
jgi:hypothetical protein